MKLEIDIYGEPEPLEIGVGDGAFKLHVRRFSDVERLNILDGIRSSSLAAMWAAASVVVVGWSGFRNKDGSPIPFTGRDNATGRELNNFRRGIALAPIAVQANVLAALAAFAGLPRETVQPIADVLAEATGVKIDTDPTSPPPKATGGDVSPG